MNTRLQVEHPITEMVNGIDLVKEQIRVAAREKLSFTQEEIIPSGHAIECRIYAEDGFNNFAPSTGIITEIMFPHGLGVRMDEGVRVGQEITIYYDPLLGKLITWGKDRKTALQRMIRALKEFQIAGIETSIPFCLMVLQHNSFQEGNYSTHTLDTIKNELLEAVNIYKKEHNWAARIGAVHAHHKSQQTIITRKGKNKLNNWTVSGRLDELQ
jgi:acetyl/propionyl-CoA carboxylase alpha subunit